MLFLIKIILLLLFPVHIFEVTHICCSCITEIACYTGYCTPPPNPGFRDSTSEARRKPCWESGHQGNWPAVPILLPECRLSRTLAVLPRGPSTGPDACHSLLRIFLVVVALLYL